MRTGFGCLLLMMIGLAAHAGGELEKPEAFYIDECDNKRNASACRTMAEQTVCGRGYNEETARYMRKACEHHSYHCERGDGPACTANAQCVLSCLSWETYWDSELAHAADETTGCHLTLKLPGETKAEKTQAGIKRVLESLKSACETEQPRACFLLGWASATEDVGAPEQAKQALQKSCDLKSAEGCITLSKQLETEAKALKERACELGERSACAGG